MPESPSRFHLRQISLEALYGRVVELLVDFEVMFQDLAKFWRETVAAGIGAAVMRPSPRLKDSKAPGEELERLGHALRDADDVNLIEDAQGFFSPSSALLGVAQVDAAGGEEERLQPGACRGHFLGRLYQRGQRARIELLAFLACSTAGIHVHVPQSAHELRFGIANNSEDAVSVVKAQSVRRKDMAGDEVMASYVIRILRCVFPKSLRAGRRISTLVARGKPLIDACTACFEYMKENGFSHPTCSPSLQMHTNEQSVSTARQAGIGRYMKIQRLRYAAVFVAAVFMVAPPAAAQMECAPRATALAALAEGYGEQVIGGGRRLPRPIA